MTFLKRRVSATVWELIVLLVVAIIFATVYRLYFSRSVTLSQVCERLETMQNSEVADMFNSLTGDAAQALKEANQLCQVRRPMKEPTPGQ
jgi:ABC-type protease/lipase transport system fused ATPase/permease subunit